MKKLFLTLSAIILFFSIGYTQAPNMSDGHTPDPGPPPVKKPDSCKLTGFRLPCCTDTIENVSSIATVTFDKTPCTATFNPATISPSGFVGNSVQSVTACAGGVCITRSINVVNTNKSLGFTPISLDFSKIGNTVDRALDAIFGSGGTGCSKSGSLKPSGSLGYDWSYMCCPTLTPCVKNSHKFSGSVSWNFGVTCHFPVAGCPYVASLDAVVSAGISGGFSVNAQTGCAATKVCAGANLKVSLGGGIGATVLAGAVSASLQLVISASASAQVCVYPLPVTGTYSFNIGQVSIVGSVETLWGLTSHSVDYVIYDGKNFGPYPF